MTRGMDYYQEQIIENCPVDVVAASNTAMMPYPLRLGHVSESSPSICDRSDRYILDSQISSDDVTTTDVLERGADIDTDWVVPVDELNDPTTTTDRVVEMFIERENYDYHPDILVPLQSNMFFSHVDHYHSLSDELSDYGFELEGPLAVGGVKEESASTQIECVMDVKETVGDTFVHLLGGGYSLDWVVAVRECPGMIDGLDMSTAVKSIVRGNRLVTPEMDHVSYPQPRGSNSTVLSSMLREYVLYLLNFLMGPDIRESDAPSLEQASDETRKLISAWKEVVDQSDNTEKVIAD